MVKQATCALDYKRKDQGMIALEKAKNESQRNAARKKYGWTFNGSLLEAFERYGFDRLKDVIPDPMHQLMIIVKDLSHGLSDFLER